MTAPNHIVGGLAITGISLSFFDINIFSSSTYLSLCIFSSLLPDIDHPKSMIGKVFYPLAKYLDRNFGHRTITHSLSVWIPLFIFLLLLELNIINPYFERKGIDYSLIFLFAYLSHLILDMLTVQGIPLFFPFMKNPCVVPANPTMRLKSGNLKSESIALLIFGFVLFSSYDLFENGFWTTYNRSFGTLKHAFREFKESENIVSVYYEYSFNGQKEKGNGYILEATETDVDLWINNGITKRILKIDSKDLRFKNISIKPKQTNTKYAVNDFNFFNLTIEQINDTLKNKIVSGKILSSDKFIVNNYKALKGSIELNKEISPKFKWFENDTLKKSIAYKLEIKEAKLNEVKNDNFKEKQKLLKLKNDLKGFEKDLKNAKNIYSKNKFERLIIQQKNKINNFNLTLKNMNSLVHEIDILKRELNYNQKHYFTGTLKIYNLPDEAFKKLAFKND